MGHGTKKKVLEMGRPHCKTNRWEVDSNSLLVAAIGEEKGRKAAKKLGTRLSPSPLSLTKAL